VMKGIVLVLAVVLYENVKARLKIKRAG